MVHEIGLPHDVLYRREVLEPLFRHIRNRESSYVVAAGSMGKTRLVDHIKRADVQHEYLHDDLATILIVPVDMNAMHEISEWGFYELLLMAITKSCGQQPAAASQRGMFIDLASQVMREKDALRGLRFFELIAHILCEEKGLYLCIMLDDFDQVLQNFPPTFFKNLQAVRVSNKNMLTYSLFLRNIPEWLRKPDEIEGFYELISRNRTGLGPYREADALATIRQIEAQKHLNLDAAHCNWVYKMSGGHPGLIRALIDVLNPPPSTQQLENNEYLIAQPHIAEEFRKLLASLSEDEQTYLKRKAKGDPNPEAGLRKGVSDVLRLKGLLQDGPVTGGLASFFCPLFPTWLSKIP